MVAYDRGQARGRRGPPPTGPRRLGWRFDGGVFLVGQPPRLVENLCRRVDLADVVHPQRRAGSGRPRLTKGPCATPSCSRSAATRRECPRVYGSPDSRAWASCSSGGVASRAVRIGAAFDRDREPRGPRSRCVRPASAAASPRINQVAEQHVPRVTAVHPVTGRRAMSRPSDSVTPTGPLMA